MSKLDRFRVVRSHDKDIEVENVDNGPPAWKTRDWGNEFAKVPLKWAAAVAKAKGDPDLVVFTLLAFMAWKTKGSTFTLSNDLLRQCGVGRETKRRSLDRWEAAGVIRVKRHGRSAPNVTLLIEVS